MRKNLFIAIVFVLIANFISAQTIQSQTTRIGFFAGPVAGNMWEKVEGKSRMHDYALGATLGILLDVPMQRIGSFQPGVAYIGKNSKDTYTDNNGQSVHTKTNLSYLEVPMNVVFRIPNGSGNVAVGGGVAAARAFGGKETRTVGTTTTEDKKLSFSDDYNRYDFGLNVLAGYEFQNGFFVHLNYNWGINRLFVGGDVKDKLFNNYLALKAGFLLGGKKGKK